MSRPECQHRTEQECRAHLASENVPEGTFVAHYHHLTGAAVRFGRALVRSLRPR